MESLISTFTDTSRLHHRYHHSIFESFNLHRGQGRLLHKLEETGGISQRELAERLNISPATLTKMVQNMEKNGFIERHTDKSDQRKTLIHLSKRGKDVRILLNERLHQVDKEIFKNFTNDEKDILQNMLIRIQSKLKEEILYENNN